jgi:hypothetical protein
VHLDRISEAIAHFIGLFHTETEQARLRDDYLAFKALQAAHDPAPADEHAPLVFQSPYDFDDPDPGIHYVPAAPEIANLTALSQMSAAPIEIPIPPDMQFVSYPDDVRWPIPAAQAATAREFHLQPPGSVASHVAQVNHLVDNDFVHVGLGNVEFHMIGAPNLVLDALVQDASQDIPLPTASFGSTAEIGGFVSNAVASLDAFVAAVQAQGVQNQDGGVEVTTQSDVGGVSIQADISVFDQPLADAIYVNGHMVSDAPMLDDYLPAASPLAKSGAAPSTDAGPAGGNHLIDGAASSASGASAQGAGGLMGHASVELGTGANALVNSASLVDAALGGGVFAVAGNHYSLDAIVQVNAWSDSDSIGASMSGWSAALQQPSTSAFNIASMAQADTSGNVGGAGPASLDFPKTWAVTEIKGDFVCLNWTQQLNFVIDNDTCVTASASGVTTQVGTGGNETLNSLSIADLGNYYDLVLVGGHYYDANIIAQTNVLLDDDVVGALSAFQTSGQGSVSTGGNLLWNDAKITSVGNASTAGLPDYYHKALQDFADGKHALSSDVLNDSAFQGLAGLRVLYISGDVYDLQYIQQTNVLGDADQVALVMNGAHDAASNADWSVTTGSNALVNTARIVDVDPASKVYVGGDHYSDELLVQTDIIRTDHLLQAQNGDHLVNEAVAFLSDDMAATHSPDPVSTLKSPVDVHPGHSDVMQSVVS